MPTFLFFQKYKELPLFYLVHIIHPMKLLNGTHHKVAGN